VTIYENNDERGPTGAEGGELLDAPVNGRDRRHQSAADETASDLASTDDAARNERTTEDDRADTAQPGLDTTNLPGDNRPPAGAHPWRGGPGGGSSAE